jgi:hypothetical protein
LRGAMGRAFPDRDSMKRCMLSSVRLAYDFRPREKEQTSLYGRAKAEFRRDYNTKHVITKRTGLLPELSSNRAET